MTLPCMHGVGRCEDDASRGWEGMPACEGMKTPTYYSGGGAGDL